MGQVFEKPEVAVCRGCPRRFDDPKEDLCQVPGCGYCKFCHRTVYGQPQPHDFNDEELIES